MILIIGGAGSGKLAFAKRLLGATDDGIDVARLGTAPVLAGAQELVRPTAHGARALGPASVAQLADELSARKAVIVDEVGCGIVPIDADERAWREAAGRLSCELAKRACAVVRMVAGVPELIKGALPDVAPVAAQSAKAAPAPFQIVLIRHGATPGNRLRRYVGARTDESIDGAAQAELARTAARLAGAAPERVFTSGMRRTDETARILFPAARIVSVPDLREMDFGAFEARSAADMEDNAAYRAWVDGGCAGACPGGESCAQFVARTVRAFLKTVRAARARGDARAVFVVHGGTVAALLSTLSEREIGYFDVKTPHGGAWRASFEDGVLFDCEPVSLGELAGNAHDRGDAAC